MVSYICIKGTRGPRRGLSTATYATLWLSLLPSFGRFHPGYIADMNGPLAMRGPTGMSTSARPWRAQPVMAGGRGMLDAAAEPLFHGVQSAGRPAE
jgi:hypothetical protein